MLPWRKPKICNSTTASVSLGGSVAASIWYQARLSQKGAEPQFSMAASGDGDNRLGFGYPCFKALAAEPEIMWRNIYDHPRRGPMLLEGAADRDNRIRCSSVIWHVSGWRHRQTAWHGRWEHLSRTQVALTFSCRLQPSFLPRIVFDWVEEFHCYVHDVTAILLRSASMAEDIRFKKFPLLTSKDLQQGEEFDEKHYLMAGAADELTGAELKQAVLEFDADFEHVKFVAAGSLGHLPPVQEEWADFPAQAWHTCTGRSPHLQSCQQIPKASASAPPAPEASRADSKKRGDGKIRERTVCIWRSFC